MRYEYPEGYDVAQICLNGHLVNKSARSYPQFSKDFCEKCGAKTIMNCPKCGKEIQGYYHSRTIGTKYSIPVHCHNCGNPFPWTESKIKAAQELISEIDNLQDDEKGIFSKSLDDIIRDTPNTPVAATRIKRTISKVGKEFGGALRDILIDVATEGAKKILWPK